MSYSPIPLWALQDSDGVPRVGAKVKFYLGGTSTPQAVYSDRSRTSSLGTSLTVDASGNVQMFYMLETTTYKVEITDSDDVVLYTFDDLVSPGSTGTGTTRTSRATCPLDNGAVGDGIADEQSEVQTAIDDATGYVDLAGKTYRCDSKLTLKSGVRIVNGTINASNSADPDVFSAAGSLGSALLLTADGDAHDMSVELSTGDAATLSADDWVEIRSSQTSGVGTSVVMGEFLRVRAVSGTTVSLTTALRASYAVANAATLRKVTPLTDIVLEDVTIISGNGVSSQSGVNIDTCEGVKLIRVKVVDVKGNHFKIVNSINTYLEKCIAENVSTQINNISYSVGGCLRTTISECISDRNDVGVSHGLTGNHVDQDLVVDKCHLRGCSVDGVVSSSATRGLVVNECRISGSGATSSDGVHAAGVAHVITNNEIMMVENGVYSQPGKLRTYTTGALDVPPSKSDRNTCLIEGNKISMVDAIGIYCIPQTGALDVDILRISGNDIYGCKDYGVYVGAISGKASYANVDISDNTVVESGVGVHMEATGTETISGFTISNNRLSLGATGSHVISLDSTAAGLISDGVISGNTCHDGNSGISIQNCSDVLCKGNQIKNSNLDGILFTVDAAGTYSRVRFVDNIIDNPGGTGLFIYVNSGNIQYFDVSGLQVNAPADHGVYLQCASSRTASHCSFRDITVSSPASGKNGIRIEGVALGDVSSVKLDGCHVYNADEAAGVYINKCSGLSLASCSVEGNTSATDIAHAMHVVSSSWVNIDGALIRDIDGSGIVFENASGVTCTDIQLRNCSVTLAESYGIDFTANDPITGVSIKDCSISLCLDDCIRVRAVGADAGGATLSGLSMSGNNLQTVSTKDAIALIADDSVGPGILSRVAVRDNVLSGLSGTYQCLTLSGDGDYTNVSVHGNSMHGGTNALELNCTGTVTRVRATSNQFFGSITDDIVETNGTFEYKGEVLVADAGEDSLPNFV